MADEPVEIIVDGTIWTRTGITRNGETTYAPRETDRRRIEIWTYRELLDDGRQVRPRSASEREAEQLRKLLASAREDARRYAAEANGRREYGERLRAEIEEPATLRWSPQDIELDNRGANFILQLVDSRRRPATLVLTYEQTETLRDALRDLV